MTRGTEFPVARWPKSAPRKPSDPTERQIQILAYIGKAIDEGLPPSVREVGLAFGIKSTNGVADHFHALERKGLIVTMAIKLRGIRLTDAGRALLGKQPGPPPSELEAAALAWADSFGDSGGEGFDAACERLTVAAKAFRQRRGITA